MEIKFQPRIFLVVLAMLSYAVCGLRLSSPRRLFQSSKLYLSSTIDISPTDGTPDSQVRRDIDTSKCKFGSLGLNEGLLKGLTVQNILDPTPVQKAVIPRILSNENVVMTASTGSGKTLAYILPALQSMQNEEMLGYQRSVKRPRCLVLVPTRELARQVLGAVKGLGHHAKVSSTAVIGGEDYSTQKMSLNRMVDIVVASPGRLMQHRQRGNVFFSNVNKIIIDEVDTMLTQGFGSDIRGILKNVFQRAERTNVDSGNGDEEKSQDKVQVVMATATLTKLVRTLLEDMENGGFNIEYSDPSNKTPARLTGSEIRINMKVVEVDGVHRILPHVQHKFEPSGGGDKISQLKTVLAQMRQKRVLVFCNTIDSCRAVDYAINEDGQSKTLSYHGDMNSVERQGNMDAFRRGDAKILVCTDIAARGIDIPDIDHVVMFDFPMNPIDYLHRAGRCGRAGRKGCVTSLISKRDEVLANAIQNCIKKGLPIDSLSASKRDYAAGGKLAFVAGRSSERPETRGPKGGRRGSDESRSKGQHREEKSFKKEVNRASLKSETRTKRFLAKTSSPRSSSSSRTGR